MPNPGSVCPCWDHEGDILTLGGGVCGCEVSEDFWVSAVMGGEAGEKDSSRCRFGDRPSPDIELFLRLVDSSLGDGAWGM